MKNLIKDPQGYKFSKFLISEEVSSQVDLPFAVLSNGFNSIQSLFNLQYNQELFSFKKESLSNTKDIIRMLEINKDNINLSFQYQCNDTVSTSRKIYFPIETGVFDIKKYIEKKFNLNFDLVTSFSSISNVNIDFEIVFRDSSTEQILGRQSFPIYFNANFNVSAHSNFRKFKNYSSSFRTLKTPSIEYKSFSSDFSSYGVYLAISFPSSISTYSINFTNLYLSYGQDNLKKYESNQDFSVESYIDSKKLIDLNKSNVLFNSEFYNTRSTLLNSYTNLKTWASDGIIGFRDSSSFWKYNIVNENGKKILRWQVQDTDQNSYPGGFELYSQSDKIISLRNQIMEFSCDVRFGDNFVTDDLTNQLELLIYSTSTSDLVGDPNGDLTLKQSIAKTLFKSNFSTSNPQKNSWTKLSTTFRIPNNSYDLIICIKTKNLSLNKVTNPNANNSFFFDISKPQLSIGLSTLYTPTGFFETSSKKFSNLQVGEMKHGQMIKTDHSGWLLWADGRILSKLDYNELWTWAQENNLVGPVGQNGCFFEDSNSSFFKMHGLSGRVTLASGTGLGLSNRVFGQKIGEENHTLSIDEMPSHDHDLPMNEVRGGGFLAIDDFDSNANPDTHRYGKTYSRGNNAPHNNMQPSAVLNSFIYSNVF